MSPDFEFAPGDVVAFYGDQWVSRAIRLLTAGPSHVGIVVEWRGRRVLVESTTLIDRDCLITRERRHGVQAHDPWARVAEDYAGRAVVHRLVPGWQLSRAESSLLTRVLVGYFVVARARYDWDRVLIAGATPRLRRLLTALVAPDPHAQFCSELCAFALMRVGRLNHGNPLAYSPASLVRTLARQGKTERHYPTDYRPRGAGLLARRAA